MVGKYSHFGSSVSDTLAELDLTQHDVSKKLGTSYRYFNHVLNGHRKASADYVDLVANALALSDAERVKLHQAAAKDHGFKLDLTEK